MAGGAPKWSDGKPLDPSQLQSQTAPQLANQYFNQWDDSDEWDDSTWWNSDEWDDNDTTYDSWCDDY